MDLIDHLRASRLRVTSGRMAVLEAIRSGEKPLTIEEIISDPHVSKRKLDTVTVYRIVHACIKCGILRQIDFQEGKFRYELASLPHHHHIVCTICGAVAEIDACLPDTIDTSIKKKTGFQVASHALEFFGICPSCRT